MLSLINTAAIDVMANGLFGLAKIVVTFTIVFVGLAFSDITSLMGLSIDGSAGPTAANLFSSLFSTIFVGFVLFFIMFTAIHLINQGIIKRQYRMAINSLLKTIGIFVIAVIIYANPAFWLGLPNRIVNYGQAIVLSSMAGFYDNSDTGQPSLCTTNVANINDDVDLNLDDGNFMSEFEKVNKNMRSLIGCQMWEKLLFRPWVRGQFGVDYDDLHAGQIGNINSAWVGEPSVPLGNEQTIDNWALFHLSTQTNAHAPLNNANYPTLINGVNADWWRTVDALSNYHEDDQVEYFDNEEYYHMGIVDSEPTKYWQSWVGNNKLERINASFIALLFGISGSVAPFIFAFSSAMYGIIITLLMITSPIFLLFGIWRGKGDSIFNGWLNTLINTMIKRVGVSILLILSLALTSSIMDLAYSIGIIKSFVLMVIVTMLLIKNKTKLLNMLASVNLGGADISSTAANLFNKGKNQAKNVGKVGLATVGGLKAGRQTGQGAVKGAKMGANRQIRNTLYQSQFGMNVIMEMDSAKPLNTQYHCAMCHVRIAETTEEVAYQDDNGNYYCRYCSDEVGIENLYETIVGKEVNKAEDVRTVNVTKSRSYLSHSKTRDMMEPIVINNKFYWNDDKVRNMTRDNITRLIEDGVVFKNMQVLYGIKSRPPAPPEPIQKYIDITLVNKAWTDGQFDVVENTYKEAWNMWYEENASHVEGITQDDIEMFKQEILEHTTEIDVDRALELIKEQASDKEIEKIQQIHKTTIEDKYICIYKDNQLQYVKLEE